jgi:hypothetical protein
MRSFRSILTVAVVGLIVAPVLAQDNNEGPWGVINADNFRRARSSTIPVIFGPGSQAVEAWRYLPANNASNRVSSRRCSIVFDAQGNVYWRTVSPTNKMTSVTPDGVWRWNAKDEDGSDFIFGSTSTFNGITPIIGQERVYVLGVGDYGTTGHPVIAAFNKSNGNLIWKTVLTSEPSWAGQSDAQVTPALYNGKLYVLGMRDVLLSTNVYRIDAATGAIDWTSAIDVPLQINGSTTLVPDIYGPGEHGFYFNGDSLSGSDGVPEMYAVRITNAGANLLWSSDGGKCGYSHVIYSPLTGRLYTPTWDDYGPNGERHSFWVWDPVNGLVTSVRSVGGGHGFYDVAALDWDDRSVIAHGFNGQVVKYTDNGGTDITTTVYPYNSWFGEGRILGALLKEGNDSVLVYGTNSRTDLDSSFTARAVLANLAEAQAGPFDDGAMYVDDIEIYDGNTLVYSTNFNSYTDGPVAGQDGWVHDNAAPSGDDITNPVVVLDDPTGSGQGKVISLNAAGVNGGWVGAFRDIADTTQSTARIRFKQWRAQTSENVWFAFGNAPNDFNDFNGWGIQWDSSRKIHPWHFDDGGSAMPVAAGVWQTIEITYDFGNANAVVSVNGNAGTPVSQLAFNWGGFCIQVEGTAVSDIFNVARIEYNTGINANHAFTTRGGVVAGPDGKLYYFHSNTTELVALTVDDPCAAYLLGDSDGSGAVNNFDIDAFVLAISNPEAYTTTFCDGNPACTQCRNDLDGSGAVNNFDIDPFVDCLNNLPAPGEPCP